MPSVIFWKEMSIVDDIKNSVAVLECHKIICFTVTNTQNQIACSSCRFQSVYGLIESFIPLKDVSEHESERITKATLFTECLINKIYADFADGQSVSIDS